MPTYTYEVTVSEQHWAEGCDVSLGEEARDFASRCCPVYRAMAEAGLPVDYVWNDRWAGGPDPLASFPFPLEVSAQIRRFDAARMGRLTLAPQPITFYVDLEA